MCLKEASKGRGDPDSHKDTPFHSGRGKPSSCRRMTGISLAPKTSPIRSWFSLGLIAVLDLDLLTRVFGIDQKRLNPCNIKYYFFSTKVPVKL